MSREPNPLGPIEAQLDNERSSSLGEAGKRLEAALEALDDTDDRIDEAATAAWYYLIVRESLNLYDHKQALAIYGVPPRVLARIGVVKRSPR